MEQLTKEELKVVEKWLNNQLEDINKCSEDRKERLLLALVEDNKDELEWQKKDFKTLISIKRVFEDQLSRVKYAQNPDKKEFECCSPSY